MITVLSPAKTLDYGPQNLTTKSTTPDFLDDSSELIGVARKLSKSQLSDLMGISEKLADLNHQRYRDFSLPFTEENAKQALLAFKGDVYTGFDCERWKAADFTFAQKQLRILSGLYGLLRPLDLMQPYRLEMGTKLKTKRGKDLYEFWGDQITDALNEAIAASKSKCLVNLASNEYFSSVRPANLSVPVVAPVFKDEKNGKYKIISFYAKKARGMMANFIVVNRLKKPGDLQAFDVAGYHYDPDSSTEESPVFLREESAK
ncbi:MAG: peroxide stress protein YaaA [Verrucomicrobiota bacterium]